MKFGLIIIMALLNVSLFAQSETIKTIKSEKVKIEIWSDVVCPFCYLGKKKMERAITELNAGNKIDIVWRSFQLDPNFPEDKAFPSIEYLSEMKGLPIRQVRDMGDYIKKQGQNYDINFDYDKAQTFNTKDVHRLIHWAKSFGLSNQLKEAFMLAYFSEGINLSKDSNIYKVIQEVGLDAEKAKEVLQSDLFIREVEQDINKARALGVRGVPFFLINEEEVISGAQSDQVFKSVLTAALKNSKASTMTTNDGVCAPDTDCN